MNYTEVRAAFFQIREGPLVAPPPPSAGRCLRDAIEPIAAISFWSEPAIDAYSRLGLDALGGYVLSRSSPMGEAAPAVVVAAFGVFAPDLVEGLCTAAREVTSTTAMLGARLAGAREALGEVLGDVSGVGDVVAVLRRAAAASPAGRPLFAGLTSLPPGPTTTSAGCGTAAASCASTEATAAWPRALLTASTGSRPTSLPSWPWALRRSSTRRPGAGALKPWLRVFDGSRVAA